MVDQQQGPQVISPRIQKLQQLQDNKRSQQLKPYLLDCAFNDITRPKQHQPLTQQQATIQKKKNNKIFALFVKSPILSFPNDNSLLPIVCTVFISMLSVIGWKLCTV
jgi:hypothetical protein